MYWCIWAFARRSFRNYQLQPMFGGVCKYKSRPMMVNWVFNFLVNSSQFVPVNSGISFKPALYVDTSTSFSASVCWSLAEYPLNDIAYLHGASCVLSCCSAGWSWLTFGAGVKVPACSSSPAILRSVVSTLVDFDRVLFLGMFVSWASVT